MGYIILYFSLVYQNPENVSPTEYMVKTGGVNLHFPLREVEHTFTYLRLFVLICLRLAMSFVHSLFFECVFLLFLKSSLVKKNLFFVLLIVSSAFCSAKVFIFTQSNKKAFIQFLKEITCFSSQYLYNLNFYIQISDLNVWIQFYVFPNVYPVVLIPVIIVCPFLK